MINSRSNDLDKNNVTVIYMAGSGRSGSTLLELAFNKALGQPATGELIHIWGQSLHDVKCGCGEVFSECEFWGKVFVKQPLSKELLAEVSRLKKAVLRWRFLPWLIIPGLAPRKFIVSLDKFVEYYEELYLSLARNMKSQIIVDSSKNILMLYLFKKFKKIDFKILHLVRDPRGVVYSWRFRRKVNPSYFKEKKHMREIRINKMIRLWWFNFLSVWKHCKSKTPCVSVTYDDFVLRPEETLQFLGKALEIKDCNVSVIEDRKMTLTVNHTISGNPMRFKRGEITIQTDDEWKRKMPFWAYWYCTLFTWPWLLKNNIRKEQKEI